MIENSGPKFGDSLGYWSGYFGVSGYSSTFNDAIIQSDGKILATGLTYRSIKGKGFEQISPEFLIVRVDGNGKIDNTFSNDGWTSTSFDNITPGVAVATAIALQEDNKIVTAGWSYSNSPKVAVARYLSDGSLDKTFSGDGLVTTDTPAGRGRAYDVLVQSDGKILISGHEFEPFLIRYLANGDLDTSFSFDGIATFANSNLPSNEFSNHSIGLQRDGKIISIVPSWNGKNYDIQLSRYLPTGEIDKTFGARGLIAINIGDGNDFGNAIKIQPDDKIVVAGSFTQESQTTPRSVILRFLPNGQPDGEFGESGLVALDSGKIEDLAILSDGRIAVSGSSSPWGHKIDQIAVLNSEGDLDHSVSADGKIAFNTSISAAKAITIDQGGNIFTVGDYGYQALIAKILPSGEPDFNFNLNQGVARSPVNYLENSGGIAIFDEVTISDPDLDETTYNGSYFIAHRENGIDSGDRFYFLGNGINRSLSGYIYVDSLLIGQVDDSIAGVLKVLFNEFCINDDVNRVVQSIHYVNDSDNLPANLSIRYTFSDGNSGNQGLGGEKIATREVHIETLSLNDPPMSRNGAERVYKADLLYSRVPVALDPEGQGVKYILQSSIPTDDGTLEFLSDGTFLFTPGKSYDNLAPGTSRWTSFSYSAIDTDGAQSNLATVDIEVLSSDILTVNVSANTFNDRPLKNLTFSLNERVISTDEAGFAVLHGVQGPNEYFVKEFTLQNSTGPGVREAINLQDAVSILKMIAGQLANADATPVSRFQSLAADFDGSGTVSLADAFGVLRHAVGMQAPSPSWVFVEEGDDALPSVLSPGIPGPVAVDVTPPGPIEVNLIGVLRGDVDGSYGVYGS